MTGQEKLVRLCALVDEATAHALERDPLCKSSEGYVSVGFGNYWDRDGGPPRIGAVEVYSYILGPSRNHYFDSLDEALETIEKWHSAEMADEGDES